jgi:hypothetical protein
LLNHVLAWHVLEQLISASEALAPPFAPLAGRSNGKTEQGWASIALTDSNSTDTIFLDFTYNIHSSIKDTPQVFQHPPIQSHTPHQISKSSNFSLRARVV